MKKGKPSRTGRDKPSGHSTVLTSGKERREGRRIGQRRNTVLRALQPGRGTVPEKEWPSEWATLRKGLAPILPPPLCSVIGPEQPQQVWLWRGGVAPRGGLPTMTASLNRRNEPLASTATGFTEFSSHQESYSCYSFQSDRDLGSKGSNLWRALASHSIWFWTFIWRYV